MKKISLLSLLLFLFSLTSCDPKEIGGNEDDKTDLIDVTVTFEEQAITPAGGTIQFTNGLTLDVPAGAVDSTVTLKAGFITKECGEALITASPRLLTKKVISGLVVDEEISFNSSVKVTLPLQHTPNIRSALALSTIYPAAGTFYYQPTILEYNGNEATATFETATMMNYGLIEMVDVVDSSFVVQRGIEYDECRKGRISIIYDFTDMQFGDCQSVREYIRVEYLDCPAGTVYEHDIKEETAACNDDTPPSMTHHYPAKNEEEVDIGTNVIVRFSEPVLTAVSIDALVFDPPIEGDVTTNPSGTWLIFNPKEDLEYNTTYTVKIDQKKLLDRVGNYLDKSYSFSFKTEPKRSKWRAHVEFAMEKSQYWDETTEDTKNVLGGFHYSGKMTMSFDFAVAETTLIGNLDTCSATATQDFTVTPLPSDPAVINRVEDFYAPSRVTFNNILVYSTKGAEDIRFNIAIDEGHKTPFATYRLYHDSPFGTTVGELMEYKLVGLSGTRENRIKLKAGTYSGNSNIYWPLNFNDDYTITLEKLN